MKKGARGWRCPGARGALGGAGAAGSAGERAGVTRGQLRPRGRGSGGPGREDAPGLGAPVRAGWSCLGRRLEQVVERKGLLEVPARGSARREAGREAPLVAPAPPWVGAPLRGFSAAPGQRRCLSPFSSQPAGPSAILPPAAGPAASPLRARRELIPGRSSAPAAPWACPGPCPVLRLCSGLPRSPRSPPALGAPRPDAGEEAGLGRWADADQER